MGAFLSVCYGLIVYPLFLGTFLYAIGFIGNIAVPKSIDTGTACRSCEAVVVNLLLLSVFAVQHSVMARRSFKRWWTRVVPPRGGAQHVRARREPRSCASVLAMAADSRARDLERSTTPSAAMLLWAVFWLGWAVLLVSTFLINHFELFGVRQVFARLEGSALPEPEFRTPYLYRYVRHPIYLGFVLGMWATPVMTAGHLLFAATATGYILVGIWFEERDLIAQFGERYRRYREQVGMLVPSRRAR